jgi:hypothetical protein
MVFVSIWEYLGMVLWCLKHDFASIKEGERGGRIGEVTLITFD